MNEASITISGLIKSSFVDYPGHIACVLFVPGCNYDCYYCHNRCLLDGSAERVAPGLIDDFLRKRAGLLDGVVISGGEPTLQKELIPFIKEIKKLGYEIKLDTNGSSPEVIQELLALGLLDYYAVDYKAPAHRYREICRSQRDAEIVLRTVDLLHCAKVPFEVRTTVIPQLHEEDLITMAKELPLLSRYVLNPYRKPERYLPCDAAKVDETPYTKGQIEAFAKAILPYQPNVMT
jgi:pyruvate formate lyase activating enzyme